MQEEAWDAFSPACDGAEDVSRLCGGEELVWHS